MSINRLVFLAVATSVIAMGSNVLPGTPCADLTTIPGPCDVASTIPGINSVDPRFTLGDPSVTDLGIFVIPGDVILFEVTNGSDTDKKTWSDLLHFATGPNSSIATVFPDLENGVIGLPPGFTLAPNHVGIQESLTDPSTVYVAGSASYIVLSDCAGPGCEVKEPGETPEPTTEGLLGIGIGGLFLLSRKLARK